MTFLVGENGTGKSTLLEALAVATDRIAVGLDDTQRDKTLDPARQLASAFRCAWSKKTQRGFFLRAEDFFGYARRMRQTTEELVELEKDYESRLEGYALQLAKGSVQGQRHAITRRYGDGVDARSHGESFLHLFQTRFVPGGLYLLDEPEAPLSPQRQLALLAMLNEMVAADAQFIVATHSPILMAFKGARIVCLDETPPKTIPWEDVPHVALTRAFLKDPDAYLRRL